MAVMSDPNRADCCAEYIRQTIGIPITKAQLRAAIDAADQWASDNAASYNSALPTAARNNLTATQKAKLLMFVINKRHSVGV